MGDAARSHVRIHLLASILVVFATSLLAGAECTPAPPPPVPPPSRCEVSPDVDQDGADSPECGGTDCDDTDPGRFPGATEVCDGADVDEDCNPTTPGFRDADEDGFGDALCINVFAGSVTSGGDDCDDARADVHPDLAEVCDGRDNDCDGGIDEGVLFNLFADGDGDGHGNPDDTAEGCAPRPGYSFSSNDCNDERADVNPGSPEVCDGLDNNCDLDVDEGVLLTLYVDADDDGFGTSATIEGCVSGPGLALLPGDCEDANPALVNGSMRCADGFQYEICQAGEWSAPTTCPFQQQCFAQPNGLGSCL